MRIHMFGLGGELDCRTCNTPEEVPEIIYQMAKEAGALYEGDSFRVEDMNRDDDN